MKTTVNRNTIAISLVRVIVGILFIFSGLVKANDPLGLSYKMQEFFELWGMTQFNSWTLTLSILIIAFEIIAGAALLLGWKMRTFSWLLLLLILFFTFLTGYAYLSGKFKNCGCFGDCIPITSKTSFLKDVALTILIGYLFWQRDKIRPVFSSKVAMITMIAVTLFSFGIQWYTLNYLPVADCLPYKKGNNISEQMKIPAGAKPDSFAIRFIYKKDGKEFEFSPTELPADLASYEFMKRTDKLIRKGNAEPPIKGFALSGITDIDSTQFVLSQPYSFLLFVEDFTSPVSKWKDAFSKLYLDANTKNIPVYMITARPSEAQKQITGTEFAGIQVFKCDNVAIRTAARDNPTLYLLKEGTVLEKWSSKELENATTRLEKIPVQNAMPIDPGIGGDTTNMQTDTTNQQE
jgi:uncharacterized membrane protein YphA (DoxX/SURF4 family)